jgi:L-lactate dehydrogenase complex protein LldG
MSAARKLLVQSLADVDVEHKFVQPDELTEAINACAVGETVGIPAASWERPLADSVEWEPTPADLRDARTGVTAAQFAIADYGSLVLPSSPPANELVSLYVDRHIAVLRESQILPDMEAAFDQLDEDITEAYNDAVIATGPSTTADMGALVKGAHGPSEVRTIVVED